ncbi:phosphotransferase [Legionella feeleii]|uniref:Choline kinase n=1 Tax=Legionella feeleii TaxID=453 RepID=A0A378INX2_9GAMM|nr:phosphotransferase [Legionella feeleii]STX36938.1 choline kinase [Legionella feeleii]
MKLRFFGSDSLPLDEGLCVYILSFLKPKERQNLTLVSKEWRSVIKTTEHTLALLPTMQRIPQLCDHRLPRIISKPLSGGMTNGTSLVELDVVNRKAKVETYKWALRIAGKGSSAFIKRQDEAHNAKQATDLCLNVDIDFFDEEDGLQLTRYLENSQPLNNALLANPQVIQAIGLTLKRLHQSDAFQNTIDVFSRNTELLKKLIAGGQVVLPMDIDAIGGIMVKIESLFRQYRIKMVPCHNDPTPSNFLWVENAEIPSFSGLQAGLKLIDWEYSGNNDGLMDVVYFVSNAKYDEKQETLLLAAYFGDLNDAILAWCAMYKPVVEWWITLWSWTQIANKTDVCELKAYQDLAQSCYEKTKVFLASEDFAWAIKFIEADTLDSSFNSNRPF